MLLHHSREVVDPGEVQGAVRFPEQLVIAKEKGALIGRKPYLRLIQDLQKGFPAGEIFSWEAEGTGHKVGFLLSETMVPLPGGAKKRSGKLDEAVYPGGVSLGQKEDPEDHKEDSTPSLHPDEIGADPQGNLEKEGEEEGGEKERHSKPETVHKKESHPLEGGLLGAGNQEDRAQDRTDAGGPAQGKGKPHPEAPEIPGQAGEGNGFRLIKGRDRKKPEKKETKKNNHDPGKIEKKALMKKEEATEGGGGSPEPHKDDAEPQDKKKGVEKDHPPVLLSHRLDRDPAHLGKINGDEGENAGA
jgi:hypothetical protein